MSENKDETIKDILREMREHIGNGLCLEFADRIESAYRSQLAKCDMCTMSCRESGGMIEQYAES